MAGAGVSIGGAGMLRARRRDVSVKPNRKLDRKSSRGMIYENEELRLRTININAEVEQGHNDIKKLRRENEQLRHEIWSLRDEYDKLEEILKSQKNREAGEDYEDPSEAEDDNEDDDAEDRSDYSEEEAEEDHDEKEKDLSRSYGTDSENSANHEERLENAENQKISTEKMSNSSTHRLHVEFDDLSVVDEEDELKKDRELKESGLPSEARESANVTKESDLPRVKAQIGYQCYSPRYGSPGVSGKANSYYREQKFPYQNFDVGEFRGPFPIEPSAMLLAQCPGLFDQDFQRDEPTYGSSLGWRSNVIAANIDFPTPGDDARAVQGSAVCPTSMFHSSGQPDDRSTRSVCPKRGTLMDEGTESATLVTNSSFPSLSHRRKILASQMQLTHFYGDPTISGSTGTAGIRIPGSTEVLTPNGWDFGRQHDRADHREVPTEAEDHQGPDDSTVSSADRPKHFFAPLAPTVQHSREDSMDKTANLADSPPIGLFESFGTGKSSGSDRTCSTVVSAKHFQPRSRVPPPALMQFLASGNGAKGPADICVNGGVAADEPLVHGINGERSYRSSNDLFIDAALNSRINGPSRQGSSNHLVKSVSCQDLSYNQVDTSFLEMMRSFQADVKCQKLTKSENSLDSTTIKASKPFRSQLNVTLRLPCAGDRVERPSETPEIPKLPSIDYRLFNNPFLKTFDARARLYGNYDVCSPIPRPVGMRVTSENSADREKMLRQQYPFDYSSALLTQSFARRLNPDENILKATRDYVGNNGMENERHRGPPIPGWQSSLPIFDPRTRASSQRQRDFQAPSFEAPNPRSLHPNLSYEIDPLRILSASSAINPQIKNHPSLYQNVPFVPDGVLDSQRALRLLYEAQAQKKVPAQTQTSVIEDDSHENRGSELARKNSKSPETDNYNAPLVDDSSEASTRRKHSMRKERASGKVVQRPLSPAAQRRRLRKQASIDIVDEPAERSKTSTKIRQLSPAMTNTTTTTTVSDHMEEKVESRSSSSGQDSPRKEHNRRVSVYFNSKKRPSLGSIKKTRSFSIDRTRDNFGGGAAGQGVGDLLETTNSERERTNSASSREAAPSKTRKSSISSGKVPWCACWGNGCV